MSDTPKTNEWDMLPPGDVEPEPREVCRELNAHNQWRMGDYFRMSLQALDWWRQHDERERLARENANLDEMVANACERTAELLRELEALRHKSKPAPKVGGFHLEHGKVTHNETGPAQWLTCTDYDYCLTRCADLPMWTKLNEILDAKAADGKLPNSPSYYIYNGEPPEQFGLTKDSRILWWEDDMYWHGCRFYALLPGDCWMKQLPAPGGEG